MKNKQRSFLLIFGLIILFIVLLFRNSVIQRSEQKTLLATLAELETNNINVSRLDTITLSLQTAENNFRMYTALWKPEYFVRYTSEIKFISGMLERIAQQDQEQISGAIVDDLKSKRHQMVLYGEIKKLVDSIANISLQINTGDINERLLTVKPYPIPKYRKTVVVEEKKKEPEAKKKKFFQRLKSAILNKSDQKDSAATLKKTETSYVNIDNGIEAYNKKQLERISKYYKSLLEKQRDNYVKLTDQEQRILKLNERIFANIKRLFNEFKDNEATGKARRAVALKDQAKNSLAAIDLSDKMNFALNILSYVVILLLLYKLYRAYDRTLKANRLAAEQVVSKSRFFTNISHEMRTPLNAIIGVSEQLKSTPLNEDQKAMSKLLDTSSSMLLSAVNEVLDFSRLETGKLSLAKTPFSYKRILSEIVDTTKVLADQKNLLLELDQTKAKDLILYGDPYRLKQIVMNLTANAIKFTDKGKVTIKVGLKEVDAEHVTLLISVIDTGIGISADNLSVVFNEFSQVINTKRVDWQKGSGLGLSISKKLVDLHKGKISVESSVGKGTTFHLELPYVIAADQKAGMETQQAPVISSDRFKNIHLLVVDDSEMNLLVIKMIFKKQGISFDTAVDGFDALSCIEGRQYDMILTDIQMPKMDGLELTQKIRAIDDRAKSHVPIIAITGQISAESHAIYLSSGLNDYIIKPFSETELMEKILDYLP
ncbi:ATP-binding protein [Pedobacter sp. MC2016-24]|uniref:ATP-binding protein n=1 Tax=Pedobacter sp. MC2016-24 TaxID=2780090 RepID=UPI001882EB44|nr:ATP-binding protein [Pedobacter sp. MC2016-24]MBE9601167.1 response regulator [Pedobacter sp. MC2016-24]